MKFQTQGIVFLLITILLTGTSCISTRVEASPYQDTAENLECQKVASWSYFWGLSQKRVDVNPEVAGNACACEEGALSWVVVKSSFTDFLLGLATLGTINHRTITYGCARPAGGDGPM